MKLNEQQPQQPRYSPRRVWAVGLYALWVIWHLYLLFSSYPMRILDHNDFPLLDKEAFFPFVRGGYDFSELSNLYDLSEFVVYTLLPPVLAVLYHFLTKAYPEENSSKENNAEDETTDNTN